MKRISLTLLLAILAFVFVIPAFAQETFGLTSEQFDSLLTANANSAAQEQWTLNYTVDFSLTGAEATPITATLSGVGTLDIPNEALSISLSGNVSGGGVSFPLDGELRVIGEAIYFRASDPTTNTDTGWFYIEDIDTVMEGVEDLSSNPDMLVDAFSEGFVEGFAGGAGISAEDVNTEALMNSANALAAINPADFIEMALEGSTYTTSLNLVNLVNSPAFSESVLGLVQAMGEETTEDELAAVIAIVAVLLEDTSISASQTVNADGLITQTILDIQSTIDPSKMGETGEIITIGFNNTMNLTYGQPALVEVPANATLIPTEAIEAGLSELSGSSELGTTEPVIVNNPTTVFADTPTTLTLPEGLPAVVSFSGNGMYTLEVRGLDGADTYVTVTDVAGLQIGYNDDHGTPRNLAAFDSAIENLAINGEVTIEINRYSTDLTNVELIVITEGGSVSNGDTPATNATTLTLGTPNVVTLPNGIGTMVELSLTANGNVSITAKGINGVDTTLEVFDASGSSLGYNDDHGTSIGGLGAFDSALENLAINGTVTVLVSKFGETGGQVEVLAVGPDTVMNNNGGGGATNFTNFTCNSVGQDVQGDVGTTVNGTCPAGCGAGTIWGTAVYTDDSNICTAAQHSGAITPANGGSFLFIVTAGQSIYPASTQNGVASQEWGEWGRSFTLVPLAGGAAANANATSNVDATTYDFPNGVTFQAPNYLTLDSETDILTMFSLPNTGGFVQVYETQSLFGTMDMGMDFYKDTYGASAAATWGFSYNKANFQDVTVNGRTISVMDFIGKSVDRPINGVVAIAPYTNGGYGYIYAFAVSPAPETFRDDMIALAGSLDN